MKECLKIYEAKLKILTSYILAECISCENKYIEKILDVSWSILDMVIWYIPSNKNKLDGKTQILDIYSTKLGSLLTYTYYLLKEKFDNMDINIGKRFKYEINRRIMKPFIKNSNSSIEAECLNNVVFSFLVFEDDYKIRHEVIRKSFEIIDNYKDLQMHDASLLKYINTIYMASGGVFEVFDEEVFLKMKKYFQKKYDTISHIDILKKDIPIDEALFVIFNMDEV